MKKGFTLIELLAVIVILAIIVLIATPIVLNIINDTKESAVLRSADFYIDALENEIMLENMKQGGNFNPNTCTITNKEIKCDGVEINLKVDGEAPTSGSITFEEGKVKDVNLTYLNGNVTLNNKGELVLEEVEIILAPGLYDEKDNLLASWDELETFNINDAIKQGSSLGIYIDFDGDGTDDGDLAGLISTIYPEATKFIIDSSVTSIGSHAFEGSTSLTSITIPSSVTSIAGEAFSGCTSLTSIIIPDSITEIADGLFSGCSSLTSITIPSSVTSISSNAFSGCTSLTSITIPNSVTRIGLYAFNECSDLKEIILPIGITSIEEGVFYGCSSLTSITIPSSVVSISSIAFQGSTNLTTIYYKGTATGSPWGAPNAKVETNF